MNMYTKKKMNQLKKHNNHLKKKALFKVLFLFYKKHNNKINSFLDFILNYFIYFYSFQEVLLNISNKKSIFSILMSLYEKKLKFLNQFNFFYMNYLNSFCKFNNLSIFDNKVLKTQYELNSLFIEKRSSFYVSFINNYFNIIKKDSFISLNNICFFLFLNKYLNERHFFLSYINNSIDFLFNINVLYKPLLLYLNVNLNVNNKYFNLNSLLLKQKSQWSIFFLLNKTSFFDLLDFSFNWSDRILFLFDYCPFYLSFVKNYLRFRFFYHLIMIYYLWDIISIYWTHILDSEYSYYGIYKQIILKYKRSLPKNHK